MINPRSRYTEKSNREKKKTMPIGKRDKKRQNIKFPLSSFFLNTANKLQIKNTPVRKSDIKYMGGAAV